MRDTPLGAVQFLAGFPLAPIVIVCAAQGGWWTWTPLVVLFGAVPLIDALGGVAEDARVPPDLDRNPWFRAVTWAWVPVQLVLVAWVLAFVRRGGLAPHELAGIALSTGATTGAIGITFAHELVHRRHPFERALGEVLLTLVSYTHFAIEHVHGHHRNVGTPLDAATARFGESFYRFLPRSVGGGIRSAWQIEAERLARRGQDRWSPSNRMLRYAAVQVLLYPAIWWVAGGAAVAVFALQALAALTLLEAINYIEHYGLVRKEIAPGEYERIAPAHSWDSTYRLTNRMLINLARHADHHCVAAKRYQALELLPGAPRLPAGYGAMFLLALAPPLWFRVMNPRVESVRRVAAAG